MENNSEVTKLLEIEIHRLGVSPNHLGESDGVKIIESESSLYGIEMCSEVYGTIDLNPKATIENLRSVAELEGDRLASFWKNVVDSEYVPTA